MQQESKLEGGNALNKYYLYGKNGQYLGSVTADKQPDSSVDFAPPLGTISAKLNESKTEWIVISSIDNTNDELKQLSQLALQQAQFQAKQQKLNSQLALQLAQLTAKEAK